ncbi:MAG: M3 family metallopeptidase [Agarilytica sp.]
MTNPLLENHTLPPFDTISAEHVVPAFESMLHDAETALDQQLQDQDEVSWASLCMTIEARQDVINQAWAPVSHLNSVLNDETFRSAYEKAQAMLSDYYTGVGQNKKLFEAYRVLAASGEYAQLSQPQRKTIDNALRDFELSGIALEGEAKARYKEIKSALSKLTTQFSNNVLDANKAWFYHIEKQKAEAAPDSLEGLPEFILEGAKQAAEQRELGGYVFTLDLPVYFTVMSQSKNREMRAAMYEAYCTRASELGPNAGEWNNTPLIEEILGLRQELAKLLDKNNYAEVSLAPKMAETPVQVENFLVELAEKTRPFAEKECEELQTFAREKFGLEQLEAWDVPYISEQLKLEKYNISQETLRPYFPLETVKKGLFELVNRLYGIEIRSAEVALWHKDASYYEILRDGKKIASFYFDLYARENKRGGAWMADCRDRRIKDGELQLPVAFLVCNFNSPVEGKPCLLNHNEVTTLFHEFGHGLHHMMTQIDVAAVSGINGVEWDAVELPSQFMENFCWEEEVLAFISGHFETGEPLLKDLLDNMLQAKNFQSAMQMLRQIEFSLFDLRLHMRFGGAEFPGVQALLNQVREEVAVLTPPAFNKFQNGFSHIFAGGYAAGYYSYKWAEVLSADAYSAFEEEGVLNSSTGKRFLQNILEKGGSQSAMELFKNFRGREPKPDALLRHSGLAV